jgi:hypothetical protein
MQGRFLYLRAMCIPHCKQKDAIQAFNSLLLIFNLGKEMTSPSVTAFRLVDSFFACVFHRYLVSSAMVEFLPVV